MNHGLEGLSVAVVDLRRACELQAKSHLIHLREGYVETGGDSRAVGRMIGISAEGFSRLLVSMIALTSGGRVPTGSEDVAAAADHLGVSADLVREVLATAGSGPSTIAEPTALLARYIAGVEHRWEFVDAWRA